MKNKKILVGLLSASGIAMMLPAITSCASNNTNEPTVSSSTPKVRDVGAKATRTYFYITQSNVQNPEKTKVKMINLKVNGADAVVVSGLIRSYNDSAGNILVVFNMSLAIQQYQTGTLTFELKLTNKTAGTEYTITGFQIGIAENTSAVEYADVQGITWTRQPDDVGEDEDIYCEFSLNAGYDWKDDKWDVVAGEEESSATSIRQDILDYQTTLGETLVSINDSGTSYISVPQTLIPSNGYVKVILYTDGHEYTVSKTIGNNFTCGDIAKIKHGTGTTTIDFHPDNYYETKSWDVTMGGTSVAGTVAKRTENDTKLAIDSNQVTADLHISAEAQAMKFKVSLIQDAGKHLEFTTQTVEYQTTVTGKITSNHPGYVPKKTLNCHVEDTVIPSASEDFTITLDDNYNFSIDGSKLHGDITITGETTEATYKIIHTDVTAAKFVQFTGADSATYGTDYTATLEPTDAYHEIKTENWDVKDSKDTSYKDKGWAELNHSKPNELWIDKAQIIDNLTVTATGTPCEWTCTLNSTPTPITGLTLSATPTYGSGFTATINVSDLYYNIGIEKIELTDADTSKGTRTLEVGADKDYTYDATTKVITFNTQAVTGDIKIYPTATAQSWELSEVNGEQGATEKHYSYTGETGAGKAVHGTAYTATITPNDHYTLTHDDIKVTSNGADVAFTYDENDLLTIGGDVIKGAVVITITPVPETHTASVGTKPTGVKTLSLDSGQGSTATYNKDYTYSYELENESYAIDTTNTKCTVAGSTDLKIGSGLTLNQTTSTTGTIVVAGAKIIGDIQLTVAVTQTTYDLDFSVTGLAISGTAPTPTHKQKLEIPLSVTTGYILNTDDFDGDERSITIKVGDTTLNRVESGDTGFIVDTTNNKITIPGALVTGKVTISGAVHQYNVTVTGKPSSAFTGLPTAQTARYQTSFNFSYTTSGTGTTVTAVVKCGEKTFSTSEYSVGKDQFMIMDPTNITGPMSVDLFATNLALTGATNAFLNKEHEIDANSTDTSNYIQLTATNVGVDVTKDDDCDWSVVKGSDFIQVDNTKGSATKGKVTLKSGLSPSAFDSGTSATVRVTYNSKTLDYDVEVGSYILMTPTYGSTDCSVVMSSSPSDTTTNIVVPSRFYNSNWYSTTRWNGISSSTSLSLAPVTSFHLPETLTAIGDGAFYAATSGYEPKNLTSITIPDTVTSIGESAFQGCSGLATIEIPSGVTELKTKTFYGCTALESLDLSYITKIGKQCFAGCGESLAEITLDDSKTWITSDTSTSITVETPTDNASQLKDAESTWCTEGIEVKTTISFVTASWQEVSDAVDEFEANETLDNAIALANKFTETAIDPEGTQPTTIAGALNGFIGLEKTVVLDNLTYTMRVIDVYHDTLADDATKKAALTFDSENVVSYGGDSTSTDYKLSMYLDYNDDYWGSGGWQYTSSTLYNALNAQDTTSFSWKLKQSGNAYSTYSIYYQLNQYFTSSLQMTSCPIKSVQKTVGWNESKTSGSENWSTKDYNCYCFPLSMTEMNQSESTAGTDYEVEGSVYQYWKTYSARGQKQDLAGKYSQTGYWLVTPKITGTGHHAYVCYATSAGSGAEYNVATFAQGSNITKAVSFAFCI